MIRAALLEEVEVVRTVEWLSNQIFRDLGMAAVADLEPTPRDVLSRAVRAGHLWVVVGDGGAVQGFVHVSTCHGTAHIEQVSVDPRFAHRGLGRALIEHVSAWAARSGLIRLTMTTFVDVPWNGPYYRRLGFTPVCRAEMSDAERARMAHNEHGPLGGWPRVLLRRAVPPAPGPGGDPGGQEAPR
jgi:GNAT superfamily N-acetyltransferase